MDKIGDTNSRILGFELAMTGVSKEGIQTLLCRSPADFSNDRFSRALTKSRSSLDRSLTLGNYYADDRIRDAIEHNLSWTRSGIGKPCFPFVYLMLPTSCNLRCPGCFMGKDKAKNPPEFSSAFTTLEDIQK